MTKQQLAEIINHKTDLVRIISSDHKLEFPEDTIYDNQGKAESWQDQETTMDFQVESVRKYEYVLYCKNVPCHKVDYSNKEITDMLGATGCESESECIVSKDTRMKITSEPFDEDFKDMGYYVVELESI